MKVVGHDRHVVESFAVAVAEPGTLALLIDERNQGEGFSSLASALSRGKAFAVLIREGIAFGDFDQTDGLELAAVASAQLEAIGFRPVVVASGQPGRAHVWVYAPGKALASAVAVLELYATEVRTNGPGRYARPPLSPHRLEFSTGLVGLEADEALDRLRPKLPAEALDELRRGWHVGERSEGLLSLALRYVHAGRTRGEFVRQVVDHPQGAGAKTVGRSDDRYLVATYDKALQLFARKDGKSSVDRELDELEQLANATVWPARKKGLYFTVTALIAVGRRSGKTRVFASVRDLSDATNQGIATISRHIEQLIELGWLKRAGEWRGIHARSYALSKPSTAGNGTPLNTSPPLRDQRVFHELSALSALNGTPALRYVMSVIPSEGITVSRLAELVGGSTNACRQAVRRLSELGLVERVGSLIVAVRTGDPFRDAARLRGKLGHAERTRMLHESQRLAWRAREYRRVRANVEKVSTWTLTDDLGKDDDGRPIVSTVDVDGRLPAYVSRGFQENVMVV